MRIVGREEDKEGKEEGGGGACVRAEETVQSVDEYDGLVWVPPTLLLP